MKDKNQQTQSSKEDSHLQGHGSDDTLNEFEEVSDDISDVSWMDIPVILIFVALFFIVALQFFTRYVLNDSLGWTEEVARFFLILLGFVGSVTCVRRGKHIYLEFFYRYVAEKHIKSLAGLVEAIVAMFFGYLGFLAIELAERTKVQKIISLDISKAYIYYIIVAACFFMAYFSLVRLVRLIKRPAHEIVKEKLENFN